MTEANHRILVFTNPVSGQEDEYNEWYDEIHVSEVLEVEGFVGCQRFEANSPDRSPAKYLAIYEVNSEDPVAAWKALQKTIPQMNMSDALDMSTVSFSIFTARGARVTVADS